MITFKRYVLIESKPYQEEAGGMFTHDGKEYDLNKVLKLTAKQPIAYFKTKDLAWVLKDTDVDRSRVKDADYDTPVLVSQYKTRWVVLDGVHRLTKAIADKIKLIPGRVVRDEELKETAINV